jgi:hypothetical protein
VRRWIVDDNYELIERLQSAIDFMVEAGMTDEEIEAEFKNALEVARNA